MNEIDQIILQKLTSLNHQDSDVEKDDLGFPHIYEAFNSSYGQILETRRKDLTDFVAGVMLIVFGLSKTENIRAFIEKAFDEMLEKLNEENSLNDDKMLDCLAYLKPYFFNKEKESESDNSINLLSKEGMQELRIIERTIAYFIFSLYAYIDVYLNELFDTQIRIKIKNKRTKKLRNYSGKGGLIEKIVFILKSIKKRIPKHLHKFFQNYNGINDKRAMEFFIELRHDIAHANPLPEIETLRGKFKQLYTNAKNKKDMFIEKIFAIDLNDNEGKSKISKNMQKEITNLFSDFFKDLHLLIFVAEIGFSCIRYTAIIEELVWNYYN